MNSNAVAMLEARGLEKVFRRSDGGQVRAVDGIDLEIRRGEIFSLLGPNGAGKTTTISMISGLIQPTRGEVSLGGFSMARQPLQAKRLLGVVPQEIALYPSLSAQQNLEFFGRMYGMGGAALMKRIDDVLEFLDLAERRRERIDTYSGGMKRRINLGVGLLHQPQLIFMDEPTVGIDPQSRRRILDLVLELRAQHGMTVLYTTHLMEEAQELSDRVAIIDHGKIIALGTQGDLIQQVGAEDRLVLSVGDQAVDPAVLEKIRMRLAGVSQAAWAPSVDSAAGHRAGTINISVQRGRKALPELLRLTDESGLTIQSVEVREPDLEAVFLRLTGRALRD
jgi:ABC-2 type transport system ATP-binding protein